MSNTKNLRNGEKRHTKKYVEAMLRRIFMLPIMVLALIGNCVVYAEESQYNTTTPKQDIVRIVDEIGAEMDISSVSGISKEDFVYALQNCKFDKNGVLANNAEYIWDLCQDYEVNEFIICGLIAIESGWCKSKLATNHHNIMSITGRNGYKHYTNYSDCILDGVKLISEEYISEDGRYATGGKLTDIGSVYAPYNSNWAKMVANCAEMTTRELV